MGTDHSQPLWAQESKPQDRHLSQSSKCEMGKKFNGNVSSSFATNFKNVAFFFSFFLLLVLSEIRDTKWGRKRK